MAFSFNSKTLYVDQNFHGKEPWKKDKSREKMFYRFDELPLRPVYNHIGEKSINLTNSEQLSDTYFDSFKNNFTFDSNL